MRVDRFGNLLCAARTKAGHLCPIKPDYVDVSGTAWCHVHADRLACYKLTAATAGLPKRKAPKGGKRPGQRYHEAQQRARAEMGTGNTSDPWAWERVALAMLKADPQAASIAYHLGAIAAGSRMDFALGTRLARASDEVPCTFT